ncbi:MAG TPA: helix-turn-helix domain-containing protein [Mycobacterium sp.]|nr:helix-turn-helix domain-containing protein [Mycobacterium sp.]
MVTVEVDPARVESRLAAGEIGCPCCVDGTLGGWGHARPRRVVGVADPVRPRRARCRACLVTHVLLPVTLLLRRAYGAELVWAALAGKAVGSGHRRIAERLLVPPTTVRGWLRVFAGRLHAVWAWFIEVAVTAGVDVTVPDTTGRWRGALIAVATAAVAIRSRFGAVSVLGPVTPCRVAVCCSGGRLLAPGWPPPRAAVRTNTNRP